MKARERWKNRRSLNKMRMLQQENERLASENERLRRKLQLPLPRCSRVYGDVISYKATFITDRFRRKPDVETIRVILSGKMMEAVENEMVITTEEYVTGDIKYTGELKIYKEGTEL